MHIHRLEKIWITIGIAMLGVFLLVVGVGAFAMGMQPPTGHVHLDPEKLAETPPFDQPGLVQVGEKEYNAYIIAQVFSYSPNRIEIPVGSTVHFEVTSPDVVHGFQITGTTVNIMAIPGEVNRYSFTFDKPGEYLILCNEYCGAAHELMMATLIVS